MEKLTYNVEETGKALGLSRTSAYKAVHDGSIPAIRLGRRLVVPRVQLEKLLNGRSEGTPGAKIQESLSGRPAGSAVSRIRAEGLGMVPSPPISSSALGEEQTQGSVGGASYKEQEAKSATPEKTCGWVLVAECSSGEHHFAKKLVCGKEWCGVCGEDNSAAHKRRQARILRKLQQITQLGYFVIEFPDRYRHVGTRSYFLDLHAEYLHGWVYSKEDLQSTTKAIINVLAGKRCGRRGRVDGYFSRGLGRWHWFGEKRPGKWNPHFNVLVDGSLLAPELLEEIKQKLRAALNCPDLIVHYSYFDKPGQIVQKARYITRADISQAGLGFIYVCRALEFPQYALVGILVQIGRMVITPSGSGRRGYERLRNH